MERKARNHKKNYQNNIEKIKEDIRMMKISLNRTKYQKSKSVNTGETDNLD